MIEAIREEGEKGSEDFDFKITLTGNPFVDTGLGVIASLARLDDINKLTFSHLKSVYKDGEQLVRRNSRLKSFTQILGTNNPLFQPSYGFKNGRPSDTNKAIYKSIVEGLLSEMSKSGNGPRCWACGSPSDLDFAKICKKAVKDNGKKAPEEKWIGRDWFPLAGSIGSDAQVLPAASQPPHICPKCLFAIHYLPMGLMLLDGRLAVFQSTSVKFWYELIREIVQGNDGTLPRIQAGNYETPGKKEGSRVLVRRLLGLFEHLQREQRWGSVPKGTSLYVWRFSNSGQSPDCSIEEIPNKAITFLWQARQEGLRSEIESLVASEGKNPYYSLLRCISEGRDYSNLYPEGKRGGASPKLFALYQTKIFNRSAKVLQIAYTIAKGVSKKVDEKEIKRLRRREAFDEKRVQNLFRSTIIQMAEKEKLTLREYLGLFPLKESRGISVEWDGWNLIRFYLYHTEDEDEPIVESLPLREAKISEKMLYYAIAIYNHYVKERGKERFQREVLQEMGRGKIGIEWFRRQFIQLAEEHDGFSYGDWSQLCKLENGRLFVSELFFQMRLLWIQWLREDKMAIAQPAIQFSGTGAGLPDHAQTLLNRFFQYYIECKGVKRFYRDILSRMDRDIDLFWFKKRFINHAFEDVAPFTEEEWGEFLLDDEGKTFKIERLLQLRLALANLYRINKEVMK